MFPVNDFPVFIITKFFMLDVKGFSAPNLLDLKKFPVNNLKRI